MLSKKSENLLCSVIVTVNKWACPIKFDVLGIVSLNLSVTSLRKQCAIFLVFLVYGITCSDSRCEVTPQDINPPLNKYFINSNRVTEQ
jgi:hypothetical protein